MKVKIYSHEFLIGTARLGVGDKSMGGVYGYFEPTVYYFEKIRKYVWDFWKTDVPNYELWYSLRFNAQLENGLFLFPQGGYTFDDSEEFPDSPMRLDLAGIDTKIIEDYFQIEPTRSFVEEPWIPISIIQKITFENELKKELENNKKTFKNLFQRKSNENDLIKSEFSALCQDQRSDDVLFEVRGAKNLGRFAVLQFNGVGKEKNRRLATKFFQDLDEFKYFRMNSDKIEWEK